MDHVEAFKGKTVVISGSTRGIGIGMAEAFAAQGARVVLSGTTDAVEQVAEGFRQKGHEAIGVRADVSVPEQAQALIDAAVAAYGTVDVLVNNAGITRDGLLIRMSEADWDQVLDVNLKGAFLLTKAAARIMMKKRSGRIINITSIVGVAGNAGQANYAASKAGMIGLTKSVARELASRGVTCNAVAPGFIESHMTDTLPRQTREDYLKRIPAGRYGTSSEVAELVLFLASDKAAYITGQVIHIDGGLQM
jgi:3-oxoacyl-[acyl-carrier protein] reductase